MSRLYEATQRALRPAGGPAEPAPIAPSASAIQSFPREQRTTDEREPAPMPPPARTGAEILPLRSQELRQAHLPARPQFDEKLVSGGSSNVAFGEYRRLAATIIQAAKGPSSSIVITSAVPGEGKTLTAANLALTYAEVYGRRVLLIDADMRRPCLHDLFGVENRIGFSDCAKAGRLIDSAVVTIDSMLTLLPAGRPDGDPAGVLSGVDITKLLAEATESFDCVIFDTPPATILPDAQILSKMVETTILVVRSGSTPYQKVDRAVEAIGRERIAGVVLNYLDPTATPVREYSGYYGRHSSAAIK